ncbi:phosphatase PAP2 family protein [Hoeflea olei]|uniref:Inositolphosphotransferase Aur1/Ipt1 domain-containing protein n=1 Tax=Hoeflea olei TaxID=1480615 RepID=A0A1C1YUT6_9HYPH|nr:phosphatase PAP2 family protein [Hoeflea olei]OCW57303.1 hypothetical protein AWJ14_14095 [Hoeflea olei]
MVFLSQLGQRLRGDAWFCGAVLTYTLLALGYLFALGQTSQLAYANYIGPAAFTFFGVMPAMAILFDFAYVIHRFNDRRLLAFKRTFSSRRLSAFAAGLVVLLAIPVFQGTFTSVKISFASLYHGFPYDHLLADIDRFVHFGHAPWRYLYAVAEVPLVRTVVEINYNVFWHLICFGALFFVLTSPRGDRVRTHYLIMFLLVWIGLGNVLAGLFLSAGPAFYGAVTGDHARFGELVAFLHQSDAVNSAAKFQTYLWELHEAGRPGLGGGISAFPSVHVGLITMNACFLGAWSRRWGIVAFAYVGFVLASSVYLGWHYAIDGYVSILLVVAAYHATRQLLQRTRAAEPAQCASLVPVNA